MLSYMQQVAVYVAGKGNTFLQLRKKILLFYLTDMGEWCVEIEANETNVGGSIPFQKHLAAGQEKSVYNQR